MAYSAKKQVLCTGSIKYYYLYLIYLIICYNRVVPIKFESTQQVNFLSSHEEYALHFSISIAIDFVIGHNCKGWCSEA